jgi:hypothetical protein
MRKLTIALLSSVLSLSIAIIIRAHCGSSWDFGPPAFSPTLNVAGCLHGDNDIVGANPTQTIKTVATTVHWLVGPPETVQVWDYGQNRRDGVFLGTVCTRCFPEFFTPQFRSIYLKKHSRIACVRPRSLASCSARRAMTPFR